MVLGGIIMAVLMVFVLPGAVFIGGAIWSEILGTLLVEDADERLRDAPS